MRSAIVLLASVACGSPGAADDGADSSGTPTSASTTTVGGSSTTNATTDAESSTSPPASSESAADTSSEGAMPVPCDPGAPLQIVDVELDGDQLRVHGCGFGTKPEAAPLHFESFDAQPPGAAPTDFGYYGYGGFGGTVTVDDQAAASGDRSLLHQTGHGTPDDAGIRESFPHIAINGFAATELYVTYRLRFATHGIGRVRQLKFNRGGMEVPGANGSPCYGAMPKYYESYYPDGDGTDASLAALQGGIVRADGSVYEGWVGETFGSDPPAAIAMETWVQVEAYYRLDEPGQADGEYVTHVDGHRNFDLHDLTLRDDARQHLDCSYLVIGIDYYVDVPRSDGLSIWYDDHWVDTTRARVVIADAADFDMARIRSPQPATSWTSEAIATDLHPTGFASGDDAWVFVVVADGTVSSPVPIVIP